MSPTLPGSEVGARMEMPRLFKVAWVVHALTKQTSTAFRKE